jgi:hypothetical protein
MNFKDKAQQNLATAFSYDLCGGEGIQYAVYRVGIRKAKSNSCAIGFTKMAIHSRVLL